MNAEQLVNQLVQQRTDPPGQIVNIDGKDAGQCTAIVHAWNLLTRMSLLMGNANQLFANADPSLYTKVVNDPNNPNQVPPPGAIICFMANNSVIGTGPYAHCGVCVNATPTEMTTLEQDDAGSPETMAAHLVTRPNYAGVYGWVIPKVLTYGPPTSGTVTVVTPGSHLNLRTAPSSAAPLAKGTDGEGHTITSLPNGAVVEYVAVVPAEAGSPYQGLFLKSINGHYFAAQWTTYSQQGGLMARLAQKVGLKKGA